MTIDPSWRDFAALWGATLSTLIVLANFLPARPRFHLEPSDPPETDLTLKIINPSQRMCFVRELFRIHLTRRFCVNTSSTRIPTAAPMRANE